MIRGKPTIVCVKPVACSRLFRIEAVALRFGNGREAEFERLAGNQPDRRSVIIVPFIDPATVLLVREYAVGIEDFVLGLPQGMTDDGETSLQAANRELMEEVGYAARRLTRLCTLSLSPNCLSYRTDVIMAENLRPRGLPGDEPEPPEIVRWRLANLPDLLGRSEITEARSVAALFLAQAHLHRREIQRQRATARRPASRSGPDTPPGSIEKTAVAGAGAVVTC